MHANQLLEHLPAAERRRLLGQSLQVTMHLGEVLAVQDQASRALLFPLAGFVSLATPLDAHPLLQVGMVGCEGVLSPQLLLGVPTSPVTALVHQGGPAWRVPATTLRRQMLTSPTLRRLLMRYLVVQLRDAAGAAACLHFHSLLARLARWLLMGQDRAGGEGFAITHESLAQLLGVRRVGVTVAAGRLQGAALIHYHRGWIDVTDRAGLEAVACSCYAQGQTSYRLGMNFSPFGGERAAPH